MGEALAALELKLAAASLSTSQRQQWASKGFALKDGSWPIPDLAFLNKAISSWGRAVQAGNASTVKAHMLRRARALKVGPAKMKQISALQP